MTRFLAADRRSTVYRACAESLKSCDARARNRSYATKTMAKRETTDEHRPSPFTKPASVSVEDAGSHYSQLHGIRTPISASASDKGSAGGVVGTSLKLPFSMIGSSSGSSTPGRHACNT